MNLIISLLNIASSSSCNEIREKSSLKTINLNQSAQKYKKLHKSNRIFFYQ